MAKLDKQVAWFLDLKARIADETQDVAELEDRGYTVVPDRDHPKGELVGEPFDRTVSDEDQPESVPLDPNLETPAE